MLNSVRTRTKRTSSFAVSPVDVADIKAHTRVDNTAEDTLIQSYIDSATAFVEAALSRALIQQDFDMTLDCFPSIIRLSRAPVVAVASVKYIDTGGTEQTLDAAVYKVDSVDDGRVLPASGKNWPATDHVPNAVTVSFTAGYGAAGTDVPADILHAIRLLTAHFYEHREAVSMNKLEEAPLAVRALLNNHLWRF